METFPMETDEAVAEKPVEPEVKSDEIAPVEVCETRVQPPEIEKSPVQLVNTLDVTKLSYEVQQGYRVFVEMSADSYKNVTWPFLEPVDAEALGLWDYHERIKEPMSFHEIGCKFNNYEYNSITEVIADIRLILENCYRYNGSNHWVSKLGHKMEKILEQKLALLNRSLRDKVSLEATMALKSDFMSAAVTGDGTGRRRTAPRNSYIKMINGEDSSSLLTRLKIQEDIEERERRRIREKEKKEANLVLLQDLAEWEEKELGADVIKQLHSMWEIPSLAGLLFLLKDFLYIQDLSITELELGFVYANKSSLLARIFTALLLTPHQRKSLFKKPPMKFKVWESKLCDRMNSWYKATEKDGQELTCHQYGLDMALFKVLGEMNPLLEKSYMDLTLHQRVWILKCLCDNSLVRDYDFREHLATIAATEQRELFLGNDADNWSYLYFPIFSASDLRIYKQCPLDVPTLSKRKKKVAPPPAPSPAVVKAKVTPARPATPTQSRRNTRLRKLRNSTPSPEPEITSPPTPPPAEEEEEQDPPEPKNTIAEGFELSAYDIETLKKLCEKFDEPPPPPKKRGRKPKPPPPRKRCEVELHQTLLALLEELEKYELSFSKFLSKAKIKIMKESQEPEPEDEPEEVIPADEGEEWGSEESIEDELEDAGARNMSSDEDFVLEDEEGRKRKTPTPDEAKKDGEDDKNRENTGTQIALPQKRKAEETNADEASVHVDNDPCSISIQTVPLKLKKKRKKSTPVADVKTASVRRTIATAVPQVPSPRTTQANQQLISHVPSGLQMVNEVRAAHAAAGTTPASANKNMVAGGCKTMLTGGVFVVGTQPSTNITQAGKTSSSAKVPPKLPVILAKPSLSTVAKPSSSVALPTSHIQSISSTRAGTVSKNPSSTATIIASPSLQSQARLSTAVPGVGKVMFVTSSGVPLQVLKAVPVSNQSLVQGKTLITSGLGSAGSSTPVCVVSSSSSLSSPSRVSVPLQVLKAVPVSKQPLVQGKTSNTAGLASTSSSTPESVVSSSSSLSTPTGASVPLQILKAVPVSQQPLVQGKTLNTTGLTSTSSSTPVCVVSSSSLLSTPTGASTFARSSVPVKSTTATSQLPRSPIHKVVISAAPTKLANILSAAEQTSHVAATSASPVNPPVILVQRPGAGGVVPLAVKGGTMIMSPPSASQQVVLIRPSGASASSTTTTATTLLPGTGISVLGNTQTALGHKVVISPSILPAAQSLPQSESKTTPVVSGNKPFVQVAASPIGMKPSQPKTTAVALGSKQVITTTPTTVSSTAKTPTTTVTVGSNSTTLVTSPANSECTVSSALVTSPINSECTVSTPLITCPANSECAFSSALVTSLANSECTVSSAGNEQVTLVTTASSETTAPNEQFSNLESHTVCHTEVSHTVTRTLPSQCDTLKVTGTQSVLALSPNTDLKQNNPECEDTLLPSQTIPLDKGSEPAKLAGDTIENKETKGINEKENNAKTCSELLLDLTCYETSVSDSTGCEESDDSAPNGLHPEMKTSLPSKLTETDVKLCNGVACAVTPDTKCDEKELDSVEQNHAAVANQPSNGVEISET